jgi:hypothetical protein
MLPDTGLDRWIDDLRTRLSRGDLADLQSFDIGDGTLHLPGEVTIRTMLADLEDLDDQSGSPGGDAAWREMRRHHLLDDFRRLRELIG